MARFLITVVVLAKHPFLLTAVLRKSAEKLGVIEVIAYYYSNLNWQHFVFLAAPPHCHVKKYRKEMMSGTTMTRDEPDKPAPPTADS
jgi:hypothetical protein